MFVVVLSVVLPPNLDIQPASMDCKQEVSLNKPSMQSGGSHNGITLCRSSTDCESLNNDYFSSRQVFVR